MKFKHSILSWLGLIIILICLWGNIRMFLIQTYPTYFYFIGLGFGVLLLVLDKITRSTIFKRKKNIYLLQISLLIFPILIMKIAFFPSYKIEKRMFPENFTGPFVIIYGIEDNPKLIQNADNILIKIPKSGVFKTSSSLPKGNHKIEYEFLGINSGEKKISRSSIGSFLSNDCDPKINYDQGIVLSSSEQKTKDGELDNFIDSVLTSICKKSP